MASQVLSGSSNPSYTNNTGQNVRVVINYMASNQGITINWAGVSANAPYAIAIGRNLAYSVGSGGDTAGVNVSSNNMAVFESGDSQRSNSGLPTELMLANGQSFSAVCGAYNIVIIREDGT